MEIVIAEPLGVTAEHMEALVAPLKEAGHHVTVHDERTEDGDELARRCAEAEVAVITNVPFTGDVIARCLHLKLLDVAFTGVDLVDMDACRERGITVCNCAGYADESVAELVLGLTIDLLRHVVRGDDVTRHGGTSAGLMGTEIAGRTVGIVGTGRIGTATARLFHALGANLMGFNRSRSRECEDLGMVYGTLEEVLAASDIVSVHLPLTDETRGLIGADQLTLMKPSAILINCARGPIVRNPDLVAALKAGELAGAALDVFCHEPPLSADCKLLGAPNLILTPHVGYLTAEAMDRRAEIAFGNIVAWLEGVPRNVCL